MKNINTGTRLRLMDFGDIHEAYIKRLTSFGLTQGTTVTIKHKAPLGCPIAIDVRGATITLRKEEFLHLAWEVVL